MKPLYRTTCYRNDEKITTDSNDLGELIINMVRRLKEEGYERATLFGLTTSGDYMVCSTFSANDYKN